MALWNNCCLINSIEWTNSITEIKGKRSGPCGAEESNTASLSLYRPSFGGRRQKSLRWSPTDKKNRRWHCEITVAPRIKAAAARRTSTSVWISRQKIQRRKLTCLLQSIESAQYNRNSGNTPSMAYKEHLIRNIVGIFKSVRNKTGRQKQNLRNSGAQTH